MRNWLYSIVAFLIVVCISPAAKSELIDNGDGTISDTDQQIMWTKDAGMAASMTFQEAQAWASGLSVAGYTDWRLPSGTDPRSDSTATSPGGLGDYYYNAVGSEFGYLFYSELGGCSGYYVMLKCVGFLTEPNDDPDLLLFENIPPATPVNGTVYWTGMTSTSNPGYVWGFGFNNGSYREHLDDGTKRFRGWAVRDAAISPPARQCADGIDNDGDGKIDMDDQNCCSISDDAELANPAPAERAPQCSDTIDNDDDCDIDYPDDTYCSSEDDPSESMRCSRVFFYGWVCLSRTAWAISYLTLSALAAIAGYAMWRRRRKDE